MPTRVDLHSHTTASDGRLAPEELVRLACACGIAVLGITDHDTTSGALDARAAVARLNLPLEIVVGVEINSSGDPELGGGDIDFLGYVVDPQHAPLQERLALIRNARVGRARGMVEKLAARGLVVRWERVLEIAGDADSIARPHIARALLEAGHVATLKDAFDLYIGDGGPCYVDRLRATAREAIDLVHAAGGLAIMAHPHHAGLAHLIPALAARGIDGVEVYYVDHTPEQRAHLLGLAREHALLVTGGSDFHAPDDGAHANLGDVEVPWDAYEALMARSADAEWRKRPRP
jgi:predicted metal-dependent phosphoesterase TrpH